MGSRNWHCSGQHPTGAKKSRKPQASHKPRGAQQAKGHEAAEPKEKPQRPTITNLFQVPKAKRRKAATEGHRKTTRARECKVGKRRKSEKPKEYPNKSIFGRQVQSNGTVLFPLTTRTRFDLFPPISHEHFSMKTRCHYDVCSMNLLGCGASVRQRTVGKTVALQHSEDTYCIMLPSSLVAYSSLVILGWRTWMNSQRSQLWGHLAGRQKSHTQVTVVKIKIHLGTMLKPAEAISPFRNQTNPTSKHEPRARVGALDVHVQFCAINIKKQEKDSANFASMLARNHLQQNIFYKWKPSVHSQMR